MLDIQPQELREIRPGEIADRIAAEQRLRRHGVVHFGSAKVGALAQVRRCSSGEGMRAVLGKRHVTSHRLPIEFYHFASGLCTTESRRRRHGDLVRIEPFEFKRIGGLGIGELELSPQGNGFKVGMQASFQRLQ
jgi:hypothetical protein